MTAYKTQCCFAFREFEWGEGAQWTAVKMVQFRIIELKLTLAILLTLTYVYDPNGMMNCLVLIKLQVHHHDNTVNEKDNHLKNMIYAAIQCMSREKK